MFQFREATNPDLELRKHRVSLLFDILSKFLSNLSNNPKRPPLNAHPFKHSPSLLLQVLLGCGWSIVTRGGRAGFSINNRDRVEVFLARFHPRGELLLTKKMAALSLSLSLTPCPLHFRFRSRDRDARCSDAYRAPCLFLCTLLISVSKRSPPLYFSARGWFLSRGERRRGAHFARYPFVPDEKIRMKHRALRSFIHKRGVSIRPEVVPILSSR